MKAVAQEHPMGCGIACIAYVTNTSYISVLRIVTQGYASTRGYYCRELAQALAKFGLEYDYKKIAAKTRKYLKRNGAIVFIARSRKYPEGHYLVNTKKGWMNPWINYPNMNPAKAGFNKKLPGKATWILFPKGELL